MELTEVSDFQIPIAVPIANIIFITNFCYILNNFSIPITHISA